MRNRIPIVFVLSLLACAVSTAAQSEPATQQAATSALVEQGKFTLHKFEQPIGEETYEIRRDGDSLAVKIDFKFTDRGRPSLSPRRFAALPTSRRRLSRSKARPRARSRSTKPSPSTAAITAHFRTRDKHSDLALPSEPFFTIAGYAPATMQMLMVRYWATHGTPAQLSTLPSGSVKIEPRGQDTIRVTTKDAGKENSRDEKLDRYTVEGLIWGRETLWFDANRNLVADVSTDAEFDHFEAIREGYESALGDFVGRAGADGMRALASNLQ